MVLSAPVLTQIETLSNQIQEIIVDCDRLSIKDVQAELHGLLYQLNSVRNFPAATDQIGEECLNKCKRKLTELSQHVRAELSQSQIEK